MLAVEFETHVENGMIKIPEKYKEIADGDLKIIILKQEQTANISAKKKHPNLKALLSQIQEKNIFHSINDPEKWQETVRDEWS